HITYLTASHALHRTTVRKFLHVAQVGARLPHRDVVDATPDDAAIIAGDRHRAGGGAGRQPRQKQEVAELLDVGSLRWSAGQVGEDAAAVNRRHLREIVAIDCDDL